MEPSPRPAALTCPQCGSITDAWEWNAEDGEWDWDDEWWRDPQRNRTSEDYTCSRLCHVRRGQPEPVTTP